MTMITKGIDIVRTIAMILIAMTTASIQKPDNNINDVQIDDETASIQSNRDKDDNKSDGDNVDTDYFRRTILERRRYGE